MGALLSRTYVVPMLYFEIVYAIEAVEAIEAKLHVLAPSLEVGVAVSKP